MFSSVLGLFSQDMAVDLGTSCVRLYLSQARGGRGVREPAETLLGTLCTAPTAVAVHSDRARRRRVTAIGADVVAMHGRTPSDLEVVRPFRRGLIAEPEVAEAMLLHLVRQVHGRNGWMRPRMLITVPHVAPEADVQAVREMCEAIGCREVRLMARPVAAALGARLPLHEPAGTLLVDVGAAGTEVSVLSLGSVVSCVTVDSGGDAMDRAIIEWLQGERELLVGSTTAELLKRAIGVATDPDPEITTLAKGRCLSRGVPRAERITAPEVCAVLAPHVDAIGEGVRRSLAEAPPELAADIVESGIVLAGGGAVLAGLDRALADRTGLPVVRCPAPDRAVVHGAGRVLDEPHVLPVPV